MATTEPDALDESDPLICPDPSAHFPNPAMFTEHGSGEGDD